MKDNLIVLPIKVKHVIGSNYIEPCNCAIAKAAKEFFATNDVSEAVNYLCIGGFHTGEYYIHAEYTPIFLIRDKVKADVFNDDPERVIRTLVLHPSNEHDARIRDLK